MLLEIAIGDAYGAGFEFKPDYEVEQQHRMEKYLPSALDDLQAGEYTDDTQMSLAIAELMIDEKGEWTPSLIAKYFLKAFKRDQRAGYAEGFFNFLKATNTAEEFLQNINPQSERNGAAMRSVPLGLLSNIDELLIKSEMQAKVTHDTDAGIFSSQAVALAAHYAFNNLGPMAEVSDFVSKRLFYPIDTSKASRCACDAIETVDAVFTVLRQASSLNEIIDLSVKLGGDTDSVASIACGIASLSDEYDHSLYPFLLDGLERGEFGYNYIQKIDEKLLSIYQGNA